MCCGIKIEAGSTISDDEQLVFKLGIAGDRRARSLRRTVDVSYVHSCTTLVSGNGPMTNMTGDATDVAEVQAD